MKKRNQRNFGVTVGLFLLFVLWTVLIQTVDVQPIGPEASAVGFASWNRFFHELTGVHMMIYTITDWLGLIPVAVILGFGVLGLVQLIKRRNLWKVDYSILVLGSFYLMVLAAYMLFEVCVVNYRPILIEGALEASYPSSTTLLVMCVMPTAMLQFRERIQNNRVRCVAQFSLMIFIVFMVTGRLVSGVHWFTDIIGGMLLSSCLVMLYYSVRNIKK